MYVDVLYVHVCEFLSLYVKPLRLCVCTALIHVCSLSIWRIGEISVHMCACLCRFCTYLLVVIHRNITYDLRKQ